MSTELISWNDRGSEWSRWDPHIHAPGTALNDGFSGEWDAYIKLLNESVPTIRALGVTDYCSIQSYHEVRARKNTGQLPKLGLIFPNVEMRLDVKTARGKGINIHLLFSPEQEDHEADIERILGQLTFEFRSRNYGCSRGDLISLGRAFDSSIVADTEAFKEGANQFKVSFPQLRDLFRRELWLRENCLVAVAAAQGDGTAGLQEDDAFTALREEIQRFAHIIFSGKPSDREFWLGKKQGVNRGAIEEKYRSVKPCLHGSDAHKLEKVGKPDLSRYCWIKGDLSFESLRQVVIEPELRTWIGEQPPLPPANSVVIDAIVPHGMSWLKNDVINLNCGLVAVIGARGSGKTALVDLIAAGAKALPSLLADSSFLRRATEPVDLIGDATVEELWADGNKQISDFRPALDDDESPSVCYLSQQFVDRLCSSGGLAGELRAEIERVIFEQTDPTQRYETDSFESLSELLLDPIRHRRQQQIDSLVSISAKIADEQQLHDQLPKLKIDRTSLEATLKKQKKDLGELIPKEKEVRAKRFVEVETACTTLNGTVEALRRQIKSIEELQSEAVYFRDQEEPERFAEMQRRFAASALSAKDWEAFRLKFSGDVTAITKGAKETIVAKIKLLEDGDPNIPFDEKVETFDKWPLTLLRAERDRLKKELGVDADRQRKYDALKRGIEANELTLKKRCTSIENAEGADARRKSYLEKRRETYRAIFGTLVDEENSLSHLYEPLHGQLAQSSGSLGKLRFLVSRRVNLEKWVQAGEALFDLRKETAFRGQGALAKEATKSLLPKWRSGTPDEVANAMHEFVRAFSGDIQKAMPSSITSEQKTGWMKRVGDWLYDTSHISVEYGLQYDGTAIEQLSPGTRGIVLLLLYLAIDRSDRRPLLIDQPEENLDPQSVFQDLVPHFREARERRQIIIVTHNANLVVNTDVEQVIVASATPTSNGGLPCIAYESGSLENPKVRHAVCNILEGGERAFLERERRYRLQWEQMISDSDAVQPATTA